MGTFLCIVGYLEASLGLGFPMLQVMESFVKQFWLFKHHASVGSLDFHSSTVHLLMS